MNKTPDFRIVTPWSKTVIVERVCSKLAATEKEHIVQNISNACECNSVKLNEMMEEIRTLQVTLSKFEDILREDEEIALHFANEQLRLETIKQNSMAKKKELENSRDF